MSVYTTRTLTREEAIKELIPILKSPYEMSNYELEEMLFELQGRESLPNTKLENYIVKN